MSLEDIRAALLSLDALYIKAASVQSWLADKDWQRSYEQELAALEAKVPGFVVLRVSLSYRYGHVLAPKESEERDGASL